MTVKMIKVALIVIETTLQEVGNVIENKKKGRKNKLKPKKK